MFAAGFDVFYSFSESFRLLDGLSTSIDWFASLFLALAVLQLAMCVNVWHKERRADTEASGDTMWSKRQVDLEAFFLRK